MGHRDPEFDKAGGSPLRSVFAGSVESSRAALAALFTHSECIDVVTVLGLAASASANVSGYARLDALAEQHGSPYVDFLTINDPSIVDAIRELEPDLVWIVGLSQIIGNELINIPASGCVGFHPTLVPKGRGRAPVAWSIIADVPPAATLFLIDDGVDSGPILAQVPVSATSDMDAGDLLEQIYDAIPEAVSQACAKLADPEWIPQPQQHDQATYLGIRREEDGVIDWQRSTDSISRLIRAAASPYPGAWTFLGADRVRILGCQASPERWHGAPGRILQVSTNGELLVATGDGAMWITQYESEAKKTLKVGLRLGADSQVEMFKMRRRIVELEAKIDAMNTEQTFPGNASGVED